MVNSPGIDTQASCQDNDIYRPPSGVPNVAFWGLLSLGYTT